MDGEPPFFERYTINSASVLFKDWDFFPDPNIRINELKQVRKAEEMKKNPPKFIEVDMNPKLKMDEDTRNSAIENKNKFK